MPAHMDMTENKPDEGENKAYPAHVQTDQKEIHRFYVIPNNDRTHLAHGRVVSTYSEPRWF